MSPLSQFSFVLKINQVISNVFLMKMPELLSGVQYTQNFLPNILPFCLFVPLNAYILILTPVPHSLFPVIRKLQRLLLDYFNFFSFIF